MNQELIVKPDWLDNIEDLISHSVNLATFFRKYGIDNLEEIPLEFLRQQYKDDKFLTFDIIKEFALRGFVFNSFVNNNILPNVRISKNSKIISVEENYYYFKNINFENLGYGKLQTRFKINTDLFFNNIPVDGFKYINSKGNLLLLMKDFDILTNYSLISQSVLEQKSYFPIKDYFYFQHFQFLFDYAEKNNIHFMEELNEEQIDKISKEKGVGRKKINELKLVVNDFKKHQKKEISLNKKIQVFSSLKISEVFHESSFKLFREVCLVNGIFFIKDLLKVDIDDFLLKEKGFGRKRIELIKHTLLNYSSTKKNNQEFKNYKESKLVEKNNFDLLNEITILDYFNDKTINQFVLKLEKEYGINKMSELINFDVDELLRYFDNIGPYTKWKIKNRIIDYSNRLTYKGNFLLLSTIFKEDIFNVFLESCYSEKLFDLRDLDSVTLGKLLEKHENIKNSILTTFYDACQIYKISFFKIPKGRIPSFDIFSKRYLKKMTLEEIANEIKLTRERVRQLELKAFNGFSHYFYVIDEYILRNINNISNKKGVFVFDLDAVINLSQGVDTTFPLIFKSAIKENCSNKISYLKDIDLFLANVDIEIVLCNLNKLVSEIFCDNFFDHTEMHFEELLNSYDLDFLSPKDLESFLYFHGWHSYGNYFFKGKLTLRSIFSVIMPDFKDGVRMDDKGIEEIRNKVIEKFGSDVLNSTTKGIIGFVTKEYILCDRKKYIEPKNVTINRQLLQEIKNFVDEKLLTVMSIHPDQLYNIFKEKLKIDGNVSNQYMLYGVFQHCFPEEYFYKKSIRRRESIGRFVSEIFEDYFLRTENPIHKKEIMNTLNMKDFMIANYVAWNNKILPWNKFGWFIHVKNVLKNIVSCSIDDFKKKFRKTIRKSFFENFEIMPYIEGYTNANLIFNDEKFFCLENNISNSYSLFSILDYLLNDEYYFSRPHILKKRPIDGFSFDSFFEYFVKVHDIFSFSDFFNFFKKVGGNTNTAASYNIFSKHRDELIEVSQGEYALRTRLILSEKDLELIDEVVEGILRDEEYLALLSIDNYAQFPQLNFTWNAFLLKSIIEKYSKKFRLIIKISDDWRFSSPVIVRKSSKIKTLEELLIFVSTNNYSGEKSMEKIEKFFVANKLIYRSLPKEFLESDSVIIDEYGNFRIKQ